MSESAQASQPEPTSGPDQADQLLQVLSMMSQSLNMIAGTVARQQQTLDQLLRTQATYLGEHTALTYDDHLWKIFVDTRAYDVGTHVLLGGEWENECRAIFERLIRPGDVVFDIGANIGVYTLTAARRTGSSGRVHAFEPNARLAELVSRSAAVNGCRDFVSLHAVALSNQDGKGLLRLDERQSGGATLRAEALPVDARDTQACVTRRADAMFSTDFKVDVIKMDVEGYEGCVLQGMRGILERSPDVRIMMEWCPPMMDGSPVSTRQTADLLRELGFAPWECCLDRSLAARQWDELISVGPDSHYIVAVRPDAHGRLDPILESLRAG